MTRRSYLLGVLLLAGCGGSMAEPPPVTISQGVWGRVVFLSGDFMPGSSSGTSTPVARQVHFFPLTHVTAAVEGRRGGFYKSLPSAPTLSVMSDERGFFEAPLAPGTYTMVVEELGEYYANSFDLDFNISPVTVIAGQRTERTFQINYNAAY